MKITLLSCFIALTTLCFCAQINYNLCIDACIHSEGSDAAICETFEAYGFENCSGDPFYNPSDIDKVIALFN